MAMNNNKSKLHRCRYCYPELDGSHLCIYGAKTIGDMDKYHKNTNKETCEACELFKSRYIEYPITVNGIEYGDLSPWNVKPSLVKVRLCEEENSPKTYLGIYLGEFPHFAHASLSEEGILTFGAACNPCIYVPELEKVVWGSESWWSRISDVSELKDIADEDIENVWYVKLLKAMEKDSRNPSDSKDSCFDMQ